jgi:hypothetical protein
MIKTTMKANVLFFSNNHLRDFPDSQIDETKKYVENA